MARTSINLGWPAVPGATGYKVARNGTVVTSTKTATTARGLQVAAGDTITVTATVTPPPAPSGTGLGLLMYRDDLSLCSHLTDGTYDLVIGSWGDPALPTASGEKYAYTVLKGTTGADTPGYVVLDPADTAAYLAQTASLPPGVRVFLDNCIYGLVNIPTLTIVSAGLKAQGRGLCVNAGRGYAAGEDLTAFYGGTYWAQWAAQLVPVADRIMLEHWQAVYLNAGTTPTGTGETLRPRGSSSWVQFWDQWQLVVAACAGKFVGITYRGAATDDSHAIYGRASQLLAGPGVFIYNTGDGNDTGYTDPWAPDWTTSTPSPVVDPVAVTASL